MARPGVAWDGKRIDEEIAEMARYVETLQRAKDGEDGWYKSADKMITPEQRQPEEMMPRTPVHRMEAMPMMQLPPSTVPPTAPPKQPAVFVFGAGRSAQLTMQVERVETATATAFTVGTRAKARRGGRQEAWRRNRDNLQREEKRVHQRRGQGSSQRRAVERKSARMRHLATIACTVVTAAVRVDTIREILWVWRRRGHAIHPAWEKNDEMLDGMRKHTGCIYSVWQCEGCGRVAHTGRRPWPWRWCSRCIEMGLAWAKKPALAEEVEERIMFANMELRNIKQLTEESEYHLKEAQRQHYRIKDKMAQDPDVQRHRELIAELRQQVEAAEAELQKTNSESRKTQKELKKVDEALEWKQMTLDKVMERNSMRELQAEKVHLTRGSAHGMLQEAFDEGVIGRTPFSVRQIGSMDTDERNQLNIWSYKEANATDFEPYQEKDIESAAKARLRRECRGLVTDQDGTVVARPLHKFFSVGQVRDAAMPVLGRQQVVEATQKLDGIMAFGVVLQSGRVELWTKGGFTQEAQRITRWAYEVGVLLANYTGLIQQAEEMGCTVVFEWVGRQAKIKVKEERTRLVLLQVRDKISGGYMAYDDRAALAAAHGVECVGRVKELEGKQFFHAYTKYRELAHTNTEGLVLRLKDGCIIKMKTQWWLGAKNHKYHRWWGPEQRESEAVRKAKKCRLMEVQELRAIVKHLPGNASPALLLDIPGVEKVECFYARCTGKRGAIVVSFLTTKDKVEAIAPVELKMHHRKAVMLEFQHAYSSRSSSNAWHRVRTWY